MHDLFLIEHHAVRALEHRLELRMQVVHPAALLALDEIVRQLHGARSKQGDQRHDVGKAGGLDLFHQVLHAARFELEHGRGLGLP